MKRPLWNHPLRLPALGALCFLLALLAGPALAQTGKPIEKPAEKPAGRLVVRPQPGEPGPTLDERFAHACYQGVNPIDPKEDTCLKDGRWEGTPAAAAGTALKPTVVLSPRRESGDLDGDGVPETALLLTSEPGGSGSFVYLVIAAWRGDRVVDLATTLLGDRVRVRSLKIAGGKLLVDIQQGAPGDPACCPTQLATRTFTLKGGQLAEGPVKLGPRVTIDKLDHPESLEQHPPG